MTNLFERELVAHLFEKYKGLIELCPPKNRILGVDRSRLEEALRSIPSKRKGAEVSIRAAAIT